MNAQPFPAPGNTLIYHATKHIGRAPGGGSGAQLYEVAENDNTYVVKLKGTQQGIRILFNEYVSGRLGELIGVPFGEHVQVEVLDSLYPPPGEPNIRAREPGIQFGTLYYEHAQTDLAQLKQARNFDSFPSVLVFDTFIERGNRRQYLVYPSTGQADGVKDLGAVFDQGYAFTGAPQRADQLQTVQNCVANNGNLPMKQWFPTIDAYEPCLKRVEALSTDEIRNIIHEPPLADWQVSGEEVDALVEWLDRRKSLVQQAIENYLR